MFQNFDSVLFDEQTKKIMAVLAKMKMDLDEYRSRENANATYIMQREKTLSLLLEYITQIVPEQVDYLELKEKQAFSAGYTKGYAECEKIYVWKPDKADYENYRAYSIMKLKTEMPHLF